MDIETLGVIRKHDKNKRKISFDGLGGDFVGGDNLMKTLEVYFENDTYTIYDDGKGSIYKMIEYCEENDIKWDVTLWEKKIQTKNGESND